MRVFVSLAVLFALLAIGVVATEMGLKTVVVPRTAGDGSKDDCNNKNCPPGVGSCDWCPDYGPLCNSPGWTCCGCDGPACMSCPSASSCASWTPKSWGCPDSPNDNSTRWGSCNWERNINMRAGDWSVLRCNSVDRDASVTIKWDVTNQLGTFFVSILDQINFFKSEGDESFSCLNENCGNHGASHRQTHQFGSLVASGSTGYYVIIQGFNTGGLYNIRASIE